MKQLSKHLLIVFLLISASINAQNSNTLEYYLNSAKENSPVLNDFKNQRYSLKIDSLKMKADYGFKVTGIGDAMYAPVIGGWGYDAALTNGQNITALIRVSKDLLGKNNLDTRLANYSLGIRQLLNQSNITELQLKRAVTDQYILTYAAQEQFQNAQEIIQLLTQEDTILKKLTQNAAFKQTDYLSFMVTLQQNQLLAQQRYADWLNNYATLNYLAGIVDTTLQKIETPLIPIQKTLPFEQSVYAKSYETDSMKLANDANIIKYEYQPKLSAYADGGYSSSLVTSPYKNFGASAGLSLTIPIYDGDKQKKLLQQNHLQQNTQQQYSEFQKKQYLQQSAQIETQIKQYKQMIATANEQLKYAQALIEANLKQLPTGDVKVTDFIVSVNNYINLKSGLIQFETTLNNLYNQQNNLTLQ